METILKLFRWLYGNAELRRKLEQKKAELKVSKSENLALIAKVSVLQHENVGLTDRVAELEDELAPPDPPSYLEEIDRVASEASLRAVVGNKLIYGLDDNVNDVPLLTEVLRFLDQAGIYLMKWTPERRDCDNFTRAGKGRFAEAEGWGGVIALDIQFERPLPPFGVEYHSELLILAIDDRGDDRVMRWFVIEGQEKELYELAEEMFAPDTGNRVTLIK